MKHFGDGRDWFLARRFGMMVHWGIYSVGGLHEQEMWRFGTPPEVYETYARRFDPVEFDPDAWIRMARGAGMEYLVFTAKHHDGFCMWDTAATDYNVMHTPYRRDVLRMLSDACRRADFPLVIYYSIVDWHHPAYPNLGRHHEIRTDPAKHDPEAYLAFVKTQIRELCTRYGRLHGIWWDMNVPGFSAPEIHAEIRRLQPDAVLNDRGFAPGDFGTPEREWSPAPDKPFDAPTEACDSVGVSSWGWRREEDYHTLHYFKRKIARTLALGGNYLLNAGPKPDGTFPEEARELFAKLGEWYRRVAPALTAEPCPGRVADPRLYCTARGNKLYVILPDAPDSSTVPLAPIRDMPVSARLLNDGTPLDRTPEPVVYDRANGPYLRLRHLPADALAGDAAVIELEFA